MLPQRAVDGVQEHCNHLKQTGASPLFTPSSRLTFTLKYVYSHKVYAIDIVYFYGLFTLK